MRSCTFNEPFQFGSMFQSSHYDIAWRVGHIANRWNFSYVLEGKCLHFSTKIETEVILHISKTSISLYRNMLATLIMLKEVHLGLWTDICRLSITENNIQRNRMLQYWVHWKLIMCISVHLYDRFPRDFYICSGFIVSLPVVLHFISLPLIAQIEMFSAMFVNDDAHGYRRSLHVLFLY